MLGKRRLRHRGDDEETAFAAYSASSSSREAAQIGPRNEAICRVNSQPLHGSSVDCIKFSRQVGEIPGPATEAESAIRMIIWSGERWDQSRVSPTPGWRSGVPCKRSIRDSTDCSARTGEPWGSSGRVGIEAGAPKAKAAAGRRTSESISRLRVTGTWAVRLQTAGRSCFGSHRVKRASASLQGRAIAASLRCVS